MVLAGNEGLPDLSRVFAGEAATFSWEETYQSLCCQDKHNAKYFDYLNSSKNSRDLLVRNVPVFPQPSQQSRNDFETKTAAINITPSADNHYNIAQIKSDVLWLSSEVNLSESESLRIAILEWEQRPRQRLLAGYSEAELASLKDALGDNDAISSDQLQQTFPSRSDVTFDDERTRRRRLILQYFREQAALLAVARELQQVSVLQDAVSDLFPEAARALARDMHSQTSSNSALDDILTDVDNRLRSLSTGKQWSLNDAEFIELWTAAQWQDIRTLLEILILRLRGRLESPIATDLVVRWFHMMAACEFFANVQSSRSLEPTLISQIQAAGSLVSLAMVDAASAIAILSKQDAALDTNTCYLQPEAASEITSVMFFAAEACSLQAAPAALAWTLILGDIHRLAEEAKDQRESSHLQRTIEHVAIHDTNTARRASGGSMQQSIYEDVLDHIISGSPVADPITYLLRCTLEVGRALDIVSSLASSLGRRISLLSIIEIQILQELITVATSGLGYVPEALNAQFTVLASAPLDQAIELPSPLETFINNDFLMESVFAVAAGRFPYETTPFLRLCRLLSNAKIYDESGTQYVTFRLRSMETFTQSATGPFASYHTIREDENLNLVSLQMPGSIVADRFKNSITHNSSSLATAVIPTDTTGEVISESVPPVIRWQHSYSALSLLGSWLELHYLGQLQASLSQSESADEVISEVIQILTGLLVSTLDGVRGVITDNDRKQLQDNILSEASASLERGPDTVDHVFDIMERELQSFRRRPSNTFDTSVLIACIQFCTVLVQIRPGRYWALITRSSLLESYGSDSFLSSIIGTIEAPNQNYPLLEAASIFYARTIADALKSTYSTSLSSSKAVDVIAPQTLKMQAAVILSLTRSLYIIYDSIAEWSFSSSQQMFSVVQILSDSFQDIMTHTYGIGGPSSKHAVVFSPACKFLETRMRPQPEESIGIVTILKLMMKMTEPNRMSRMSVELDSRPLTIAPLIRLSSVLARLGRLQSNSLSALETQLFDAVPLLARILAVDQVSAQPVIELLHDLLSLFEPHRPVSLLGHLGSISSLCMINFLNTLQRRREDVDLKESIWRLFGKLVGHNQQWLATVILTGTPAGKNAKDEKSTSGGFTTAFRGKPLITVAVDELIKLTELSPRVVVAMLEFVIQSQQNWSFFASALKLQHNFLPTLLNYVRDTSINIASVAELVYKNKIISLVTDFATTHLHFARATQDKDALETINSLLLYLSSRKDVVEVGSFNLSLHTNLRKNFGTKFPGVDITDFQRTQLTNNKYGDDYYYAVDFADKLFQSEACWKQQSNNYHQSFRSEFLRANLNFSLVDSELALLRSCQNFFVEHCPYFVQSSGTTSTKAADAQLLQDVYPAMISMIRHCLEANTQGYPSLQIFEKVFQSRADLVIVLLQRLVDVQARGFDIKDLVRLAWNCARFRNTTYEQAIVHNDLHYWRSTMKIVYLSLQFHCGSKWSPRASHHDAASLLRQELTNITPIVLEIITSVIGQGFKSIVAAIQDLGHQTAGPMDAFASLSNDAVFILSMLKTVLRLTRAPEIVSEASERLSSSGLIQSCLLLYSWSHTLTTPAFENEPVYAEVSLRYLVCLSSLPSLAEEMAIEGILSRLLGARTTQRLQSVPEGVGHLDKRPHGQFLYNLWVTGILPLCLNLLHSVGGSIAAEVSVFLNQFPKQLDRASAAFIPTSQSRSTHFDFLTLTAAREAASLALISFILDSYRSAGASAAVDPTTVLHLSGYDDHKRALAEDISDLIRLGAAGLSARLTVSNDQEMLLTKSSTREDEKLENRVIQELKHALICLKGHEGEDEDGSK